MKKLWLMLPTLRRLGFASVAAVAVYRLACRVGYYRLTMPVRKWRWGTDFFQPGRPVPLESNDLSSNAIVESANDLLNGTITCYGDTKRTVGSPPDWFLDPFGGSRANAERHWSTIDEFASFDIKNIWEASRFQWSLRLAQAWRLTNDPKYLTVLNQWLADWVIQNPVNQGPNWKCGQETSIRLISLLLTVHLLDTHEAPSKALRHLVEHHLARISPTIGYAIAQNNNHGTSEAAALFIGGAWLMRNAEETQTKNRARGWRDRGRRFLEERVSTLVADDGSFSQYSTNYHRVLLDCLCQVEIWRDKFQERAFGDSYLGRCRAAVDWIESLTDAESGDVPNLGANDGARLFDLSETPYRDFRPSVQLASVLFRGCGAYESKSWNQSLTWLGIRPAPTHNARNRQSVCFDDGGYVILNDSLSWALVRFARFAFRPGHADCLHVDLWHRGVNLLRDGGTFSYNADPKWLDYFSGAPSHNTVQFDGRDQMPRLSRFLFGNWIEMEECGSIEQDGNRQSWSGAYVDRRKARHRRSVIVCDNRWKILDEIGGFEEHAILRWRLMPADWKLAEMVCSSPLAEIRITSSCPLRRIELTAGWESRAYQRKTELPVLEIEVGPGNCSIETQIVLRD